MRTLLAFLVLLVGVCADSLAQKVTGGAFENLKSVRRCVVKYDMTQLTDVFNEANLKRDQEWCLGSINDELEGKIRLGDFGNYDATLTIVIKSMRANLSSPVISAVFTDKDGNTILAIDDVSDEDLNDVGHKLGKFLYRKLRKLK